VRLSALVTIPNETILTRLGFSVNCHTITAKLLPIVGYAAYAINDLVGEFQNIQPRKIASLQRTKDSDMHDLRIFTCLKQVSPFTVFWLIASNMSQRIVPFTIVCAAAGFINEKRLTA
jgi:hypothetical protein